MNAFSFGLSFSIRTRQSVVNSTEERDPFRSNLLVPTIDSLTLCSLLPREHYRPTHPNRGSAGKPIMALPLPVEVKDNAMAQMTATPASTQGFFVDGKWIEEGDPVEIRAPYDGSVIGSVFQGRREHAEAAIAAAVKAFGTTRRLPAFERQRVLRRVSENITERKQEFARTMAQESGKP